VLSVITMEGREPAAAGPVVVTAAEMVAGHVRLDISCLVRLYLNGYVARLQAPGGVIYLFHDHRGKPIASPALFEPIGEKFRREVRDWAQANGIPVIVFKAGDPLPGSCRRHWSVAGGGRRLCSGVPAGVDRAQA
jgi:hypothetical protein